MDENVIRRVQPHNNDAEKSVIGAMLMDRDVISDVADLLSGEDFYNKQYGILFENMVELYNEGRPVDLVTLSDRLKMKDVPEDICSPSFIGEIMSEVVTSANAKNHAQIVQDKAVLRRLITLSEGITNDCFSDSDKVENILEDAEGKIFRLVQNRNGLSDFTPVSQIVVNVIGEIEEAARNKGKVTGLSTGFTDLDNMLTGLHGGELLLVAARPAMGKTAFVLNIAHDLAVVHKKPCAIFSLEMSKEQLISRMIAIDAMVDSKSMKLGNMPDEDWDKVIESVDDIARAPLFIDDNSAITVSELRSKCRKLKQTQNIELIIIDYLQLMSSNRPVESRQQFISDVSRALKNIARELNVPVIALSQLSRAVDGRTDHKPVLSDLRESGAIEQDADVVMFIYRDEYYNPETTTKPQTAEIIIAKQRNGETGSIDLRWIGKYTKFADPEKHYREQSQ
ncbi:MAG: replicative DNA helicase [Clostridium sp.]|nr:replicative DNA helicase [Clostridium sp.]MCM1171282.1 replicative DNA helicase [Clostridium sp.]MCM1207448.1 replicative DNA helicase [Ruminococcus sp.]